MRINDDNIGNFNINKEILTQAHRVENGVHTYTLTNKHGTTEIKANDLMRMIKANRSILNSKECKELKGIIKNQSGRLERSDYKIKLSISNITDFRNIRSLNKAAGKTFEQRVLLDRFDKSTDIKEKIAIMGELDTISGLRSKIEARKEDMSIVNLNRAGYRVANINSLTGGMELKLEMRRKNLKKEVNDLVIQGDRGYDNTRSWYLENFNRATLGELKENVEGQKKYLESSKTLMVLIGNSGLLASDFVDSEIKYLDRRMNDLKADSEVLGNLEVKVKQLEDPFVAKMNEFTEKYNDLCDLIGGCITGDGEVSVTADQLKDIEKAEKEMDPLLGKALKLWENIEKDSLGFGEEVMNRFKNEVDEAKSAYIDIKDQIDRLRE